MTNYYLEFKKTCKEVASLNKKPTLLLHSCCAPCSTACLQVLVDFFDITIYYYNPNITDLKEYLLRLQEEKTFIKKVYGDKIAIIDEEYNSNEFFSAIKGYEKDGEGSLRCYNCYKLRLEKTAKKCKELGFDYFTTTLSISPYKNSKWLNEIGIDVANKYQTKYLCSDFKKENGYKKSIELSKKYSLYRQDYCGCVYSKIEQENRKK